MGFKLVRIDATEPCKVFIPLGSHFIGRGKFLDCNDHRVSRKHAELVVTGDSVLLKSLHQNPCFVKRKSSKETIIFCQPESQVLSNGDQFGLIPDSYWYEVIFCLEDSPDITESVQTNEKANNEQNSNIEDENAQQKVAMDEDSNTEPFNERGGDEKIDESILDDTESQSLLPPENPSSLPKEAGDGLESPSGDFAEEDVDTQSTDKLMDTIDQIVESKDQEDDLADSSDELLMDLPDESLDPPDESPDQPAESVEHPAESPDQPVEPPDQQADPHQAETARKRSHSRESSPCDVKKVKTEPGNSSKDEIKDETDGAATSDQAVKTEPDSPRDVKPGPSNDQGGSTNDGNNNAAAAPQSPPKPPNNLRERCMYGPRCYRRNPEHKAKYSHPGDRDWGGPQAPCPWGAACRKADPRHWRDHSHPPDMRPPAPAAPPAGNRPGKKQRRKKSSTSESDSSDDAGLIIIGKRARKPIVRQGWSDSEDEDPFKTDESDEWEPSGGVTSQSYSQSQDQD